MDIVYFFEQILLDFRKYSNLLSFLTLITKLIEDYGRTNLSLLGGTKLVINEALFYSRPQRNLSFKDIGQNGYHIESTKDGKIEYLYITKIVSGKKFILEKLPAFSSSLYYANINMVETYAIINQKFTNPNTFNIWLDCLGHLSSIMMKKIIDNSYGHPLKAQKILQFREFSCVACSQSKLIIKTSPAKVGIEFPTLWNIIQGDICGPIYPAMWTF